MVNEATTMVRVTAKFSDPRDAMLAWGLAARAAQGAIWPSAFVDALEAGASVDVAWRAANASCDAQDEDGGWPCVRPTRLMDGAWKDGWAFGSGRSVAVIDRKSKRVMVQGPKGSSVEHRAMAVPALAEVLRQRWAAEDADRMLAEHRATSPVRAGAFRARAMVRL